MAEVKKCPKCGNDLPESSPGGHCPHCLLQLGLTTGGDTTDVRSTIRIELPPESPLAERPGDRIGRYKLLQQLGEGGCGVVYMADQSEPVRRRVALKVIKPGMDSRQVLARFEAERQALALMDHPNIAKVLDAGATETGRPYFVMELVKGIPITRYCDEKQLDTKQRLDLFVLVCQAIQHAHQKGIIHRDIKPSNILVADHDGTPVPKIIDFGIAKATTDQRLTDKTLFTAFEQFIGTPAYMSPEQASLSGLDIDTRSDIYSLGVLLYELLTGKTPFDARELLAKGLDEIRRVIREVEPQRPSTRLSTLDAVEQTTVAHQRQSEPPKLQGIIRGDLDWIVMKALEKDRARRYETANGFAVDIQRHLNNEPVVARPPSNVYRFQKLVRRNKLAVVTTAIVGLTLVLGFAVSTWLFIKERQALRMAMPTALAESYMHERLVKANRAASYWRTFPPKNLFSQRRAYEDHVELVLALEELAGFLCKQSRLDEAEWLLNDSVAERRNYLNIFPANIASGLQSLAELQILEGKFEIAERNLLEAQSLLADNTTNNPSALPQNDARLAKLYRQWNKPVQLADYKAKLDALKSSGASDGNAYHPKRIGWWRGENNALDAVGSNHGWISNGVTISEGKIGMAFHFDGTGEGLPISNAPSPVNLSVATWVRFDRMDSSTPSPGLQSLVFRKNSRNLNFEGFSLSKERDNTTNRFATDRLCWELTSIEGHNSQICSITKIQPGVFYHVVGTFDGTWSRLYVNGTIEASTYHPLPIDYGNRPMFFGGSGEGWNARLYGVLDEVSLYDGALSAEQVAGLYARDTRKK